MLSGNIVTDDGSYAVGFEGDRNTFRNNRIQRGLRGRERPGQWQPDHPDRGHRHPCVRNRFRHRLLRWRRRIAGSQISRTLNEAIRLNVFENETASTAHRTTVVGNVVRGAGTIGIAISTDFEGSGTIARANDADPQCIGVVCR